MRLIPKGLMLALILCPTLRGQTTKTCVQSTIYDGAGNLASGSVFVTSSKVWIALSGEMVYPKTTVSPVTLGVLNVCLYPNDSGSPSDSYYNVQYNLAGGGRQFQMWRVPTSLVAIPPPIVTIPPTPTFVISLSQIARSGAVAGQSIVWSGFSWIAGVEGKCVAVVAATAQTFTHNMNSTNVTPFFFNATGYEVEPKYFRIIDVNSVSVAFDSAKTGTLCVK